MKKPTFISVLSEKGGIGKTTITFNLAAALNARGKKVLVLDLDKQRNLSSTFGPLPEDKDTICDIIYQVTKGRPYNVADAIIKADNGVSYIISDKMLDSINSQISTAFNPNFVLKKIFSADVFSGYDYVISDNKTAIDILTLNALNISDYVIIPVEAGIYSFDGLTDIVEKIHSINATTNPQLKILGILYNKVSNTVVGKAVKEATESIYNDLMFKTFIPYRPSQTEAVVRNNMSCVDLKDNTLKDILLSLADEVIERIEKDRC